MEAERRAVDVGGYSLSAGAVCEHDAEWCQTLQSGDDKKTCCDFDAGRSDAVKVPPNRRRWDRQGKPRRVR